ncbi:MAG: hypothetical protein JRH20_11785 [Deltaproteobacteria bacterium]|nr:hypothetical protein [Deltaproteobacteria bacterium]
MCNLLCSPWRVLTLSAVLLAACGGDPEWESDPEWGSATYGSKAPLGVDIEGKAANATPRAMNNADLRTVSWNSTSGNRFEGDDDPVPIKGPNPLSMEGDDDPVPINGPNPVLTEGDDDPVPINGPNPVLTEGDDDPVPINGRVIKPLDDEIETVVDPKLVHQLAAR